MLAYIHLQIWNWVQYLSYESDNSVNEETI